MSDVLSRDARRPIEFADEELSTRQRVSVPLLFRARLVAEEALLFVLRWGIAIVLLGVIARFTLVELVTPPLVKYFLTDLAVAKKQADDAAKGTGQALGYINLLIERGVVPAPQAAGALPKGNWQQPFVLNDKPQPSPAPEPVK